MAGRRRDPGLAAVGDAGARAAAGEHGLDLDPIGGDAQRPGHAELIEGLHLRAEPQLAADIGAAALDPGHAVDDAMGPGRVAPRILALRSGVSAG